MLTRWVSNADKLLEDGETLESTVHPSRWRKAYWENVLVAAVIAAGIAWAFTNRAQLPPAITPLVLAAFSVVPAVLFLRAEFEHMSHMYHFTSRKLIVEEGVFSKDFMTVPYDRITQVTIDQSVNDRMLGIGNLRVDILGADSEELIVRGIKNPQQFRIKLADRSGWSGNEAERMQGQAQQPAQAEQGERPENASDQLETLDRTEIEADLGRIQRERRRLEDAYEDGKITEDEYQRQWYMLAGKEEIIQHQLDRLEA